jgi:hypothetical protein
MKNVFLLFLRYNIYKLIDNIYIELSICCEFSKTKLGVYFY